MNDEKLTKKELKELRKFDRQQKEEQERKSQIRKKLIFLTFITIILLTSIFALFKVIKTEPEKKEALLIATNLPKLEKEENKQGSDSAKVVLIEYADFECPACKAYYPMIKEIKKIYQEDLLIVYRYFPLKSIHPNAMSAARAAYAASKQEKFWQMHDKLFENQETWASNKNPDKLFMNYAKELSLDLEKFNMDYNSKEAENFINKQLDGGINTGVNATPTFFLNSKRIPQGADFEKIKKYIEEELRKK